MAYEQRDNSGSLFKNATKTSENSPDYSGKAMVGGVEHFMDAWIKTSKDGAKWMSFSFKAMTKQPAKPRGPAGWDPKPQADEDSDIPF
jgi:hypothetical protein